MKKIHLLFVATATFFAMSTGLRAQMISVQLAGDTINPTDNNHPQGTPGMGLTAGFFPATGWNSDLTNTSYVGVGSSALSNLYDSTGTLTGIGESTINDGRYNPMHANGLTNPGDNALYTRGQLVNFDLNAEFTLTLTNLTPGLNYNLAIYVQSTFGGDLPPVSVTLGNSTVYLIADNGSLTTYTPGVGTSAGTANQANYVEFFGVTGDATNTLTLSVAGTGATRLPFNVDGFQLQVAPAPEPSTICVVLLGMFGLVYFVRRRLAFVA